MLNCQASAFQVLICLCCLGSFRLRMFQALSVLQCLLSRVLFNKRLGFSGLLLACDPKRPGHRVSLRIRSLLEAQTTWHCGKDSQVASLQIEVLDWPAGLCLATLNALMLLGCRPLPCPPIRAPQSRKYA